MKKILSIIILSFMIIGFASAYETTPISYINKISYTPYCGTTCSNNTFYNATSNITTITSNCSTGCHAVFNISLMFAGDDTFRTVQINTTSPLYQNGSDFIVPGVYMATLGNTSDVTGINQKLLNITSIINEQLYDCYQNISNLKDTMSQKYLTCTTEKDSLNSALAQRTNEKVELEKFKKQRVPFGLAGIVLGIIIIKWFIPYSKEKLPRRDPIESQHSPYTQQ
jgi:hypothetical protein